MERHGGKEVMSKKEIIEKIVATTGCSEEKAKMIFEKAIQNKDIVATLDWEWVINRLVIGAVILMALWALWKNFG
jgi:hypothetical protein